MIQQKCYVKCNPLFEVQTSITLLYDGFSKKDKSRTGKFLHLGTKYFPTWYFAYKIQWPEEKWGVVVVEVEVDQVGHIIWTMNNQWSSVCDNTTCSTGNGQIQFSTYCEWLRETGDIINGAMWMFLKLRITKWWPNLDWIYDISSIFSHRYILKIRSYIETVFGHGPMLAPLK